MLRNYFYKIWSCAATAFISILSNKIQYVVILNIYCFFVVFFFFFFFFFVVVVFCHKNYSTFVIKTTVL